MSLKYQPPLLENPTIKQISPSGGSISFGFNEDGIVEFPNEIVTGRVTINGGRNVYVGAGHVVANPGDHYTIAFNNPKNAFVEGLHVDANGQCDAFAIRNHRLHQLNFTFQNCYVEGPGYNNPNVLNGTCHGDLIQMQGPFDGGGLSINVENFVGLTGGQGFFIPHQNTGWATADLKNVYIRPINSFKQLLWFSSGLIDAHQFYPVTLDNVWVDAEGKTAPWELGVTVNGVTTFPPETLIQGGVNIGFDVDEADFKSRVGLNYDRASFEPDPIPTPDPDPVPDPDPIPVPDPEPEPEPDPIPDPVPTGEIPQWFIDHETDPDAPIPEWFREWAERVLRPKLWP